MIECLFCRKDPTHVMTFGDGAKRSGASLVCDNHLKAILWGARNNDAISTVMPTKCHICGTTRSISMTLYVEDEMYGFCTDCYHGVRAGQQGKKPIKVIGVLNESITRSPVVPVLPYDDNEIDNAHDEWYEDDEWYKDDAK